MYRVLMRYWFLRKSIKAANEQGRTAYRDMCFEELKALYKRIIDDYKKIKRECE